MPIRGTTWFAKRSIGTTGALVWTVRDVTSRGVFITSPESRSPGHLIPTGQFVQDYVKT